MNVTVSWLILKKHQNTAKNTLSHPSQATTPYDMLLAKIDNSRGHFFCNLLILRFCVLGKCDESKFHFHDPDAETEERGTLRQYRSATDNAAKTSDP